MPKCKIYEWETKMAETLDATNTIICRDCRGKGLVTNSMTGEPDDCYTCGGNGVEDAEIAVEVLQQQVEDLEAENDRLREQLEMLQG